MKGSLRYWLPVPALLLLCPAAVLLVGRGCESLRGNSRISFYGKIVDDSGHPVPNIQVEMQILYSDSIALPVMYGRSEKIRKPVVTTDAGKLKGSGLNL